MGFLFLCIHLHNCFTIFHRLQSLDINLTNIMIKLPVSVWFNGLATSWWEYFLISSAFPSLCLSLSLFNNRHLVSSNHRLTKQTFIFKGNLMGFLGIFRLQVSRKYSETAFFRKWSLVIQGTIMHRQQSDCAVAFDRLISSQLHQPT